MTHRDRRTTTTDERHANARGFDASRRTNGSVHTVYYMRRSDEHDCFPLFKDYITTRSRLGVPNLRDAFFSRARREEPREDFFRPPGNLQLDWRAKVHQRLLHVVPQLTPLGRASVHLLAAFRRLARGGNAEGGSQVRTRAARLQKLLQSLLVKVGVLVHFRDAIVARASAVNKFTSSSKPSSSWFFSFLSSDTSGSPKRLGARCAGGLERFTSRSGGRIAARTCCERLWSNARSALP